MKYIRTKDGYLLEVIRESESKKSYITKPNGWVIHKDRVIKQADTIEELCDEFIGVMDNGKGSHIWYNDEYCGMDTTEYLEMEDKFYKSILWNTVKRNRCENEIIYGAIWTDKGLIYVAKMNERGELELL